MKNAAASCLCLAALLIIMAAPLHAEDHQAREGALINSAEQGSSEPAPYVAQINAEGRQVVEITGGEYYFEPRHIILKLNVPAVFVVKRTGYIVPHNIKAEHPEAGMSFDVDMSKSGNSIEFTPTRAGTYPFFCDKKLLFFESHRHKGMEGVIEVVE